MHCFLLFANTSKGKKSIGFNFQERKQNKPNKTDHLRSLEFNSSIANPLILLLVGDNIILQITYLLDQDLEATPILKNPLPTASSPQAKTGAQGGHCQSFVASLHGGVLTFQ